MNTDALLTLSVAAAKSVVLLLAAVAACAWLRRSSAGLRHLVWTLALAAALVVPATSLLLPGIAVLPNWSRLLSVSADGATATASTNPESDTSAALPGVDRAPVVFDSQRTDRVANSLSSPHSSPVAGRPNAVAKVILSVWLAGLALCLMPLAVGHWMMRRLARRHPARQNYALVQPVRDVAAELNVRPPLLHVGPEGTMPLVWGFGRGRLLLPADAVNWDELRLRAVLLHELAHLRRRDVLSMIIGQITRAVYWFNPLAWLAVGRMRVEREQACDDYVLRSGITPSDFATTVLELSISRRTFATGGAALAMAIPSRIESRLQTILAPAQDRRDLSRRTVAVVGAITCLIIVLLSVAQAGGEPDRTTATPAAATDDQREQPTNTLTDVKPADEPTPNFLIYPVLTELQRHLVNLGPGRRSADTKAYVLINGLSVITSDGKLDEPALKLDEIRKGLKPYADRESGVVHLNVYYDLVTPAKESKDRLVSVLQEFGTGAGFKGAIVSNSYQGEGFEWEKMVAEATAGIRDFQGPFGAVDPLNGKGAPNVTLDREPMSGDDRVQAYPVRTRLSRFLFDNSDCVIDYLTPIDEASDVPLGPDVEATMRDLISDLDLKQRKKVLIRVTSIGEEGRNAVNRLVEVDLARLTEELGVEFISVRNRPQ